MPYGTYLHVPFPEHARIKIAGRNEQETKHQTGVAHGQPSLLALLTTLIPRMYVPYNCNQNADENKASEKSKSSMYHNCVVLFDFISAVLLFTLSWLSFIVTCILYFAQSKIHSRVESPYGFTF